MDCDDQVRLVKRHHDANALAPNQSDVAPLAIRRQINLLGILDQPFSVKQRRADVASTVLRMSRKAHMGLSPWQPKPAP
jgi:phage FluMu protein gp41